MRVPQSRLTVIGAGGVGGYFGALLAKAGNEVQLLARGAHHDAIKTNGLQLKGPRGNFTVAMDVVDDPARLKPADFVLLCVKSYDSDSVARSIQHLLKPGTTVITLQNGVDSRDRLAKLLPSECLISGAAFVSAVIEAPGVIRYTSEMSSIIFGEEDGSNSARCRRFGEICRAAGFGCEVVPDIRAALWSKFISLATNAALTGLARQPAGVVYHTPETRAAAERLIGETVAVGRAAGVALKPDEAEQAMAFLEALPPGMYASLFHDLDRGRPLEIESLSGLISKMGRNLGIDTPCHDLAYACLKPLAEGARVAVRIEPSARKDFT